MIKRILLVQLICTLWIISYGQPASDSLNYPRIGRPCPDFTLRNIKYFSKKQARLKDFKGKWLLLSFWNKGCAACVASFPKENQWFARYGDKMQFISIAIQDSEKQIEPMFERYKEREGLQFPVSFDSMLAKRWMIYAGPYFILIDPDGTVRSRLSMDEDLLEQFLSGRSPKIPSYNKWDHYDFETDPRIPFTPEKPFLVNDNGGIDSLFSYRSLISEFDCITQVPAFYPFIHDSKNLNYGEDALKQGRFQLLGYPLLYLYSLAWLGAVSPGFANKEENEGYDEKVVLKVKDSSLFKFTDCDNLFCYSLIMPPAKASPQKLMHIMSQDLENYFGYTASIEERKITAWKLVARDKKMLITKGGKTTIQRTNKTEDFFATNIPMTKLVEEIKRAFDDVSDGTGITENIDVNLRCSFVIRNDVLKALRSNGLDLVPVEAKKKVLVIRDAN